MNSQLKLDKILNSRKKFTIFSLIYPAISGLYEDVEMLRIDLAEFAYLYGYKDAKRVKADQFLTHCQNLVTEDQLIIVDLPLSIIYSSSQNDLSKIIDFYQKSQTDILAINLEQDIADLVRKITDAGLPVIAYSVNAYPEKEIDFDQLIHNFKDMEAAGASTIILENYSPRYVNEIVSQLTIPVIADVKSKAQGFYAQFSQVFGLKSQQTEHIHQYLNLKDMIKQGIKDCVFDNQ
ncbi:MAG: 3-methyl-2-oxobutanoate hydroxymethyltransferase [Spirochaetes bacterium]|nr:3-methyl-2-oxobutanoate hydroxymethyltransferase [Spirochaetota bacterium]